MGAENPENVVQVTLQNNVSAFESIYEKSWDKREDLAKLLITLSSTFIVAVASIMKLFYPNNVIPGQFMLFLVLLMIPVFLGCLSLWYLAELRSLKVSAFEKRHRSKEVYDATFADVEPTIKPFTELVFEVLEPARGKHRHLGRVLTSGYLTFFGTLSILGIGLLLDAYCS
ncbi:hypothetical protein Q3O60_16980 [Alkalimonas collagenimarina]|uniref:Uncharacterized protein n=1 Tax=Alkalimonas collagenimarina TaxID=400390 RepID=A0ABT9H479_9GAMM|nr:hypothetical protein [Alkalimonas collagenimarina]MDP4537879.1 hypothetical protein [Alkalimonas collagenimarina]